MKRIENLLRQIIGLDAASVGPALIHRVVRSRMRGLGLRKVEHYEALIQKDPAEWNELMESVLVAETWFFRHPEQFTCAVRVMMEEWVPNHLAGTFRVLSVPCSSGEEPYSIVMAARDAGLPAERLRVDAVDISARALARAARGVYRKNSFRGDNLGYRDRYFRSSKEGFVLDPAIREPVSFYAANLISEQFAPAKESYDCIFCRNLLIYFDPATQRRTIAKIERLLRPGGLLFVGPAEQPLGAEHGLVPAEAHKAMAFRKPAPHAPHFILPRLHRSKLQKTQPVARAMAVKGALHRRTTHVHAPDPRVPPQPASPEADELELARQFADAGRLEEAAAACQARLRKRRDCAEAYYILGLVRKTLGDASAMDCYRRALYLEPNHYESLLQMAMLSQKNGDLSRARAFKNRAQRVRSRV